MTTRDAPEKAWWAFACIPRKHLWQPPILHRNGTRDDCLTPFQFAIMAGVLILARTAWKASDHGSSWEFARKRINRERKSKGMYEWHKDNPTVRPLSRAKAIKEAGKGAYKMHRRKLREQGPPEAVTVSVTRTRLLREAGLPDKGDYLRSKLDTALDCLCHPIGSNHKAPFSPLLNWWEEQGRLAAAGRVRRMAARVVRT